MPEEGAERRAVLVAARSLEEAGEAKLVDGGRGRAPECRRRPPRLRADRPEPRRPDSSRRLEPDLQLVYNESRFGNGMAEPKAKQREQGGKLATASKATIQHAEPPPGADPSRKACCGKNSAGQRLRRASHQSGPIDQ